MTKSVPPNGPKSSKTWDPAMSQSDRFIAKAREEEDAAIEGEDKKLEADKRKASQSESFIAKARELGLDEREETFDAALDRVARRRSIRKE